MITPNDFVIEKVQLKDNQQLAALGRQTFCESFASQNTQEDLQQYINESFSLEKITKELLNPNSFFYFIKLNTQIVGYLKVNFKDAQTEKVDGNAMEIERIYIKTKFQGQKLGQLLIHKALTIARQNKVTYAWLGVWEKNIKAIKFYKSYGFIDFDKHSFMLGSDMQTDRVMKLIL
ncbi:N-acetyltransferase [Aquimarina addita]|uniref:N-acetyltransferase n=1 Tax=Aquimarina addita TaxID=870485 RepID=A0ABP6USC2_9FLAO